jgi:hypothetical protein
VKKKNPVPPDKIVFALNNGMAGLTIPKSAFPGPSILPWDKYISGELAITEDAREAMERNVESMRTRGKMIAAGKRKPGETWEDTFLRLCLEQDQEYLGLLSTLMIICEAFKDSPVKIKGVNDGETGDIPF